MCWWGSMTASTNLVFATQFLIMSHKSFSGPCPLHSVGWRLADNYYFHAFAIICSWMRSRCLPSKKARIFFRPGNVRYFPLKLSSAVGRQDICWQWWIFTHSLCHLSHPNDKIVWRSVVNRRWDMYSVLSTEWIISGVLECQSSLHNNRI